MPSVSDGGELRRGPGKLPDICLTPFDDLCFEDGDVAVVAEHSYFLVHRGLLWRNCDVFYQLFRKRKYDHESRLDGRVAIHLQESPVELAVFLRALYGGVLHLGVYDDDFPEVSTLLRLSTKYRARRLRADILRGISMAWPKALEYWEIRERMLTASDGLYDPRGSLPHPILVINLARAVDAPELLPSAFYDLVRYLPSQTAAGCITEDADPALHQLPYDDLLRVLQGRECASRFLSTFIGTELEGREQATLCLYRAGNGNSQASFVDLNQTCQSAFEVITFELLRDVNGLVCNRNSDPLFAIGEVITMLNSTELATSDGRRPLRVCEACRIELALVVDRARAELWDRLPEWFSVDIEGWGR